jgi:hypothetical protein
MEQKQKYADMHPRLLHVAVYHYQLQAQKITDRQRVLVLEYDDYIYIYSQK